MTFGSTLKQLREDKEPRVEQRRLARRIGCAIQTVSNWESGRYFPSEERMKGLVTSLKLTTDQIAALVNAYTSEWAERQTKRFGVNYLGAQWVAESEKYQVPLLESIDTVDPKDVVFKNARCRMMIYRLPMYEDKVFAFRVTDEDMVPKYNPGDFLYCDLLRSPGAAKPIPVVAAVGKRTFSRFLERKGDLYIFKAANVAARVENVPAKAVRWCYPVVYSVRGELPHRT